MKRFLSAFAGDLFAELLAVLAIAQLGSIPEICADPPTLVSVVVHDDGRIAIIAQGGTLAVDIDQGEIRGLSFTGP